MQGLHKKPSNKRRRCQNTKECIRMKIHEYVYNKSKGPLDRPKDLLKPQLYVIKPETEEEAERHAPSAKRMIQESLEISRKRGTTMKDLR
jgi:hypothetical protein